jgi:hypothetical protein
MKNWLKVGLLGATLACGGSTEPAANTTTPTATATIATTATVPTTSGPPAQCSVLSDRIDAFSADVEKGDPKTPAGLQSLGTLSMTASKDVGAAKVDGDLAGVARDASAYLADTSKKLVELGTVLLHIIAVGNSFDVEAIKKCVAEPSRRIGLACKGKTSGDCPKVLEALDAWGRAGKNEVGAALAQFRALQVTEAGVKAPVAEVVKCTAPLATAFDAIDRDKARLKELDATDNREKDIDTRFKAICGRGLFTK